MPAVLVVNGPNLNLLGSREPDVYGKRTLAELETEIGRAAAGLGVDVKFMQSNSEGAIIDFIQQEGPAALGLIINPAAFTHYSYAIRDAISSAGVRAVEVHISNIHGREEFRHRSVIAGVCCGQICGLGFSGYLAALRFLCEKPGDK
ncbi:MAG: type II 3-dehydroquinate dehydratase [Candidatus Zixiibacteriota bacterium]|nr:MAG: type II 3-dehydroquinate dehydratase [candidate division Zixibacteria bacterium]